MRFPVSCSRVVVCAALGSAALSGPALGASRSSTIEVSATVASSCTLTTISGASVASRCTRGERPIITITSAPLPPPSPRAAVQGRTEFLVVTY